ncbi:MAG: glycosyltransferase [Planctomycetes bacterium]|nr:glycosyltransferase [Planctomycetota bacterium]
MTFPHVLIDGLVLADPMGGALRYAIETWPRCAELLHARGGQLTALVAQKEREKDWVRGLAAHGALHLDFIEAPMRPAWKRALNETSAVQNWMERSEACGNPVHLLQTQSLPAPNPRFPGQRVHLSHGLRRQLEGPWWSRRLAEFALRQCARRTDALIAVSETLARDLASRFARVPIRVAPPACDSLPALPREPGDHVLCPGPLVPHKNHALLIEAWGQDPALPPLHLHARQDRHARPLIERIDALGLAQRILWREPLTGETWPEALATCAAVVLPSRLESFGLVALEALHAGAPLALSDLPAHREVIGLAQSAVRFFPPTNPLACANAIHQAVAMTDPACQALRQKRAQDFSWEQTAERTVEHWSTLVGPAL